MRLLKKALKFFAWLLSGLVVLAIVAWIALWAMSPGTAQPITGADGHELPGSISTVETVTLGGVEQYLIIRGRDAKAPVMLFLHGGPGSPEYPLLRQTNLGLEADFVMVYWEQRGAGKSYDPDNLPDDMNIAQFVADTAELSEILRARFGKEKIYLMGHSWGSLLGILTAKAHPEQFHAYFGLGQVGHQIRGEQVALDWLREQAAATGNTQALNELTALRVPQIGAEGDVWMPYMQIQRGWLDAMGGGMTHDPTSMATNAIRVFRTPEYTLSDKMGYLNAVLFSAFALWNELVDTNLISDIGRIEMPVYFLQGAHDFQTPTPLARELFEALDAPVKEFVTFEHSAHSPIMEEPEKFNAFVRAAAGLE